MASLQSRLLRFATRAMIKRPLAAAATESAFVATARRVFEMGAERNARVPHDVRVVPIASADLRGEWVLARDVAVVTSAILYMHGGAYVACGPLGYRSFAVALTRATGVPVFLLDYRLAPEHRYPAALNDAVTAYRALRERLDPRHIVLAGDSAGGNLALATLLSLRAGPDGPRPVAGTVVFSPWTDLTSSGASIDENARSDDMIPRGTIDPADVYAPDAERDDPFVSPLFGDYADAPPLLAFASTIEILRDDAVRLVDLAKAAGVDATLVLEPDMPHVWPIFVPLLPEARRALDAVAAFISLTLATGDSR